jgi:two-component system, cell cycle sensor histidine kinase and response regulator CckA
MPMILALLWALSGFTVCFAIGSLAVSVSGRRDHAHALFGIISLAVLGYLLLQISVLTSNQVARTAAILRWQGFASAMIFAVTPWFGAAFCGRKGNWFERAISTTYVALGIWSLASQSGYWFSSVQAIDPMVTVGGTLYHPRGPISPAYFVSIAIQYPMFFRLLLDAPGLARSGRRVDAWIWACSMVAMILASMHDHAVDFRMIVGPYFGEYVFPLFVLVVAARMLARRNAEYTQLTSMQASLAASEARFRDLFESASAALFIHDIDTGAIVDVNRTMSQVSGWSREECLRFGLAALSADDPAYDPQVALERLAEAARTGSATFEWMSKRRDGTVFPSEVDLKRIQIAGRPAILAEVRDITERRRLEERVRQAERLEAIGQLAGGVAHDFNNLLTPILGYSQLLLSDRQLDQQLREGLEQIHVAADKARKVTRQLLTFGRKAVMAVSTIDVNALIQEEKKILRTLVREDIELKISLDPGAGAVDADAAQIEQVVMNLVVNARDALPKGGAIAIETQRLDLDAKSCADYPGCGPGRHVLLSVSDTGIGISPEIQGRIFEPFFTTKDTGEGVGLGLATVLAIVQRHGGTVLVDSDLGKGARFRVVLPSSARAPTTERASAEDILANGNETILVVEDDEAVREFACRILEQAGHRTLAAASPNEARRWASATVAIDLVLSDVVLPGTNGRELCEELRNHRVGLKVLFMSGYPGDSVSRHGILETGIHFLQKPFVAQTLLAAVRKVLDA